MGALEKKKGEGVDSNKDTPQTYPQTAHLCEAWPSKEPFHSPANIRNRKDCIYKLYKIGLNYGNNHQDLQT
jgi:hypothetical protein